jgi:hypothetical protein
MAVVAGVMAVAVAAPAARRQALAASVPAWWRCPHSATQRSRTQPSHPGVTLVTVEDRRGPWTSYIVEVDTRVCRPVFEVRKPDGPLSGRATTSALADDAVAAGERRLLPPARRHARGHTRGARRSAHRAHHMAGAGLRGGRRQ